MAFSATKEQIRAGTKTVTRRLGWSDLESGEEFCAIEKGQGLKKGEKIVRMAVLRCIYNTPDTLAALEERPAYGNSEAAKEGFPQMDGPAFLAFFCRINPGCTRLSRPNRIEFEYVRFLP